MYDYNYYSSYVPVLYCRGPEHVQWFLLFVHLQPEPLLSADEHTDGCGLFDLEHSNVIIHSYEPIIIFASISV